MKLGFKKRKWYTRLMHFTRRLINILNYFIFLPFKLRRTNGKIEHILVIEMQEHGDFMCILGFLNSFKLDYPGVKIWMLTKTKYLKFLNGNENIYFGTDSL